ncbi:MAG: O-antigen ligase family protein [Candidatus Melainabacteria bacterium]|nr:MAG: O-antigen ligase family protein [Candidatus Melainabacteria bacterium]
MIACQRYLLWAYSICVFLPITIPWVVLGLGLALSIAMIIKERSYTPPPLIGPFISLALCVFISGTVGHGLHDGLDSLVSLRALLVYFWAHYALSHMPSERLRAVFILLCMGALDGVWGTIQQLFNFHPFEKYQYLQASGFVRNPMAFAGEMQVTACVALSLCLGLKKEDLPFSKMILLALTGANFLGVIFASERSAWLGIAFAVLTIAFCVSRKLFFKTVIAGIVLVGLLWLTVPVVKTRLEPLLTNAQNDTSTRVRLSIWKECISMWQKGPILGVGINHFPKLDYKDAVVPGISDHLTHAHSNYLHLLVTLGLPGLFAYLVLLGQTFFLAFSNWKSGTSSLDKALGLGVVGALVSLSVAGIFEYNFGAGHVRLIQWYVFAFVLYSLSGPAQRAEAHSSNDA